MATYLVTAYFNLHTRESFMDGYAPHHTLVRSGLDECPRTGESLLAMAENVWRLLNADERPNGKMERSLSIGDCLRVQAPGGDVIWLACQPRIGWTEIDEPANLMDWMPFSQWPRLV
jgi:hypothetical protein